MHPPIVLFDFCEKLTPNCGNLTSVCLGIHVPTHKTWVNTDCWERPLNTRCHLIEHNAVVVLLRLIDWVWNIPNLIPIAIIRVHVLSRDWIESTYNWEYLKSFGILIKFALDWARVSSKLAGWSDLHFNGTPNLYARRLRYFLLRLSLHYVPSYIIT